MTANYPNSLPNPAGWTTHQNASDEVLAIATALGTNPQGSYTDVKTALASTGSWKFVSNTVLSAATTQVDVSIPSDAKLLRLTGQGWYVQDGGSGSLSMWLRFNGDSAAHYIDGNSTTATTQIQAANISGDQVFVLGSASGQSNSWFEIIIALMNNRMTQVSSRSNGSGVRTGQSLTSGSGLWLTSPYARPTTANLIQSSANTWASGASLYVEKIV